MGSVAGSVKNLEPVSGILLSVWSGWRPGVSRAVDVWADQHRVLLPQTSAEPGRWRTGRVPYTWLPMNVFSRPETRLVVLKWATQSGKTEVMLNCMGWAMDEAPGPMLVVYDQDDHCKRAAETRIQPMIRSCVNLRRKMPSDPKKFKLDEMHMMDMILYMGSAQTPGDLASMPIEYFFGDECNKYPRSAKEEGDPVDLAGERLKTFKHTGKRFLVSSPTVPEGTITRYFNTCQERLYFHVPCPHCGEFQHFVFDQIRWEDLPGVESWDPRAWRHARETAHYVCIRCGAVIEDRDKGAMLQAGEWLREDRERPASDAASWGFQLPSMCSPFVDFGDVAAKYLEVKDDPARLMVFHNSWLAEDWTPASVDQKEPAALLQAHRVEGLPPRTAPAGTIAVTMGIDTQADGFWFVCRAWKADRTSYLIDYGFVPSFVELERLLFERSFQVQGANQTISIWRAAIDTGGTTIDGQSMTEGVYRWLRSLRRHGRGFVHGVKGMSHPSTKRVQETKIGKMPGKRGARIPGGLTLYMINTDSFKESIHYYLERVAPDEPGAFLLHAEVGEDYARQLLSHYKEQDLKTKKWEWVQRPNTEDHLLDCEVYSLAAADPEWLGGIENLRAPRRNGRRVVSKGVL